jgi:hypothetical protein
LIYILEIETLKIIKLLYIKNSQYDTSLVNNLVIINNYIIARINNYDYLVDKEGIFYKKSVMTTFDINNLKLLYKTESFNVYDMIPSKNNIIGKNNNKIIIFNKELDILSEFDLSIYHKYNIYNDAEIILNIDKVYSIDISPDGKYIYLFKKNNNNTNIEIWDYKMKKKYDNININLIKYHKITSDYRILYNTNNNIISKIKTRLYYNFLNYISSIFYSYSLPNEIISMVIDYID